MLAVGEHPHIEHYQVRTHCPMEFQKREFQEQLTLSFFTIPTDISFKLNALQPFNGKVPKLH